MIKIASRANCLIITPLTNEIKISFIIMFTISLSCFPNFSKGEELIYVNNHYPPWAIFKQEGKKNEASGIDVELLKIIIQKINHTYKTHFQLIPHQCPWKRCLADLQEGKADLVGTILKKPDRKEYLHFINPPYYQSNRVFYFNKGRQNRLQKYKDLDGLIIGIISGYNYFSVFDNDPHLKKEKLIKEEQLFRMLEKGRIDTFIASEFPIDYLLAQKGFQDKFAKAPYRYAQGGFGHLAISKKSPFAKYILQVNQIIEQMLKNGEVQAITDQVIKEAKQQP